MELTVTDTADFLPFPPLATWVILRVQLVTVSC